MINDQASFTSADGDRLAGHQHEATRAAAAATAADQLAVATGSNPVDPAAEVALTDDLNEGASSRRFDDVPGVPQRAPSSRYRGNESFHTAMDSPPSGMKKEGELYEEGDTDGRGCAVM
jgi:hypothetical protein